LTLATRPTARIATSPPRSGAFPASARSLRALGKDGAGAGRPTGGFIELGEGNPPFDGEVVEAGLGEMMRDDFRLAYSALWLVAQDFSGPAV